MSVSRLSRQSIQAGFPKQQSVWDGISQPAGMDALGSVTVTPSGGVSTITFSNIPQTYTHLQLRTWTVFTSGGYSTFMQFNGDTGNNYSSHGMYAAGTSPSTFSSTGVGYTNIEGFWQGHSNTYPYASITDILDYTNTNKYKVTRSFGGFDNNSVGEVAINSGLWFKAGTSGNTSDPITSINFYINSAQNFAQNTQFSLYGIK